MRIDRHFFNMVKIISYEKEMGNNTKIYTRILELYQKIRSISETICKICDETNISNEDKQYFFVTQDWDKEIENIRKCSFLHQNTRESIEKAYKNIDVFVKVAGQKTNEYMNTPNTLTKQGRKCLRQISYDFSESTNAICYEIENICSYYSEKEIKIDLLDFPFLHTAPRPSVKE